MLAGQLEIQMSADLARLSNDMRKAQRMVGDAMTDIKSSVASAKAMLEALGIGLSAGYFVSLIKGTIDAEEHLYNLTKSTGLTVKELAGLKLLARESGTDLDGLAKGIDKMSVAIGKDPEKFRALGVTAKTNKEALMQFADIFKLLPDIQQRNALAQAVFNKSWAELAPVLAKGGKSIGEILDKGAALSGVTDESAAQATKFNDQMAELETTMGKTAISIVNNLLPGMNDTALAMKKLAEEGNPVLALWRGLAGMGKISWDLLSPPDDLRKQLSPQGMISDLQVQIAQLERNKASGSGKLMAWIFGTPTEIDAQVAMLMARIDTIKKHAAELNLNQPSAPPAGPSAAAQAAAAAKAAAFLNAGKNKNKDMMAPQETPGADGTQVLIGLEKTYQNELLKRQDIINSAGMSASEKALADDMRNLGEKAQSARIEIEKLNISGTLSVEEYDAAIQRLNKDEADQAIAVKALAAEQDALNALWQYGATVALRNYLDEVQNVAKQTETMVTNGFKGMEDALVKFCQTGKLDFSSLANSIEADLLRIEIRQSITGPLAGMMGGMFGTSGMFGPGSNALGPVNATGTPMTYAANGAWFDNGAAHFAAGGIFDSSTPFKFASGGGFSKGVMGEAGPEAVMPLTRGRDGKLGVEGGGKSTTLNYAPVYHIDSRTDQADVRRLVDNSVKQGHAVLVDRLQRQGVI